MKTRKLWIIGLSFALLSSNTLSHRPAQATSPEPSNPSVAAVSEDVLLPAQQAESDQNLAIAASRYFDQYGAITDADLLSNCVGKGGDRRLCSLTGIYNIDRNSAAEAINDAPSFRILGQCSSQGVANAFPIFCLAF